MINWGKGMPKDLWPFSSFWSGLGFLLFWDGLWRAIDSLGNYFYKGTPQDQFLFYFISSLVFVGVGYFLLRSGDRKVRKAK
ncbi:MAG: hypothetical protein UW69_C0043G0009 [Microgenomates group bacterium GW2011_GWA2_44_7]|nr:MAG: hypothetical protein UW69_C0043G0009 [Microgenomates group bacterium GW2011_GWA2_44_7]